MDRLQKAVALAKEKNKAITSSQDANTSVSEVTYSDTKVHKVSDEELAERRIVASLVGQNESPVFKLLRTKVLSQMKANGWQTLAISSPKARQGKSTIAANLAVAMAMEVNQSILVVDLDLARPNLHKKFALNPSKGLVDVLNGDSKVSDVLINPGIDRLTLLPGSGSTTQSSELLSGPAMQQLFVEFRAKYKSRFVIYDMPPLMDSDNVLKTIKNFDCSLLVLEDGTNSADEIRQSAQIIKQTNYLGYVLNKAGGLYTNTGSMD